MTLPSILRTRLRLPVIAKVWRDIWGSGQGIGSVSRVEPVATLVDRLAREYAAASQSEAGGRWNSDPAGGDGSRMSP